MMTASESIQYFYKTGLENLHKELVAYPDTGSIWRQVPGTLNSGGTLFLHLIGNLRHFIVKGLANTDYIRDREAEFSDRDVEKEVIERELFLLQSEVDSAFKHLNDAKLPNQFPIPWREGKFYSTQFMLNQMMIHLNYHLGQINYHRRYFSSNS